MLRTRFDFDTWNRFSVGIDFFDNFGKVVYVALGINSAGKCQADQIVLCGLDELSSLKLAKHHTANLATANSAVQVESHSQRLSGEIFRAEMVKKAVGIQVHRMPASWADVWDSLCK